MSGTLLVLEILYTVGCGRVLFVDDSLHAALHFVPFCAV